MSLLSLSPEDVPSPSIMKQVILEHKGTLKSTLISSIQSELDSETRTATRPFGDEKPKFTAVRVDTKEMPRAEFELKGDLLPSIEQRAAELTRQKIEHDLITGYTDPK